MNKNDILEFIKYNNWANQRILNTASQTSSEQFLADTSLPHGGLRNTLAHMLFAEWIWRKRWMGESPEQRFKPQDFPTFDSLRERWEIEEKELNKFVDGLSDEQLNSTFHYKTTDGQAMENILWRAMAHVVNHGTQHRSEAAAMLTGFGFSPGDVDMILFFRETK